MLLAFPCTIAMLFVPFPWAWVLCFFAVSFLFMNIGPANTAIANVTDPAVRSTAFAVNIFVIHALGDAISPPLIGAVADRSSPYAVSLWCLCNVRRWRDLALPPATWAAIPCGCARISPAPEAPGSLP